MLSSASNRAHKEWAKCCLLFAIPRAMRPSRGTAECPELSAAAIASSGSVFGKCRLGRCAGFGVPPLGGFRAQPPKGGTPNLPWQAARPFLKQTLRGKPCTELLRDCGLWTVDSSLETRNPRLRTD